MAKTASSAIFAMVFHLTAAIFLPNTTDILASLDLPSEEHTYTTIDGHVLTMYRIPRPGAVPVLFLHGFLGSSDVWLLTKRKHNMPSVFYDMGYDVWMMNQRGNMYSKKHVSLSTDSSNPAYWNFSFHEIGLYDLSATIDLILKSTGFESLLYVGHSMGTSAFLVLLSERPEYNKKVRAAALLAPVAYSIRESKLPAIKLFIQNANFFSNLLYNSGMYELLPRDDQRASFIYNLCAAQLTLCTLFVKTVFNSNVDNIRQNDLPYYLARLSSGSSVKVYQHLGNVISGYNFSKFDYGPDGNIKVYGTLNAPRYPVERVTVPLALFYSKADPFIDKYSIQQLKAHAPNVIFDLQIPDAKFQHLDYLFGLNARQMVTSFILKIFKKYSGIVEPDYSHIPSLGLFQEDYYNQKVSQNAIARSIGSVKHQVKNPPTIVNGRTVFFKDYKKRPVKKYAGKFNSVKSIFKQRPGKVLKKSSPVKRFSNYIGNR